MVVERTQSPYGAGWSVAGTARVISAQRNNSVIHIDADGSAVIYEQIATYAWEAPVGAYRDTLRWAFVTEEPIPWGSYWWHADLSGTRTFYDWYGRQVYVIDRAGNKVEYHYAADGDNQGIDYIQIAPWDLAKRYQFTYASGKLSGVTDPASRLLTASVNFSGQLVSLQNTGDQNAVQFTYDVNQRMTRVRSRRGYYTAFRYYTNPLFGATGMLVSDSLPTSLITNSNSYRPAPLVGLASTNSGNATALADTAGVVIDGPRTDVSDVTRIKINGGGAPTTITNALGEQTTIQYAANAPLLVSQVDYANGRSVRFRYDSRARLVWRGDDNPTGTRDSTTFAYGAAVPDLPSLITSPLDVARRTNTSFTYNSNGTLQQAVDSRGHITAFTYNSRAQVDTVIEKSVTVFDSKTQQRVTRDLKTRLHYDGQANLDSIISDRGRRTAFGRDSYGNITRSGNSAGDSVKYTYDARNLQLSITQFDGSTPFVTNLSYDDDRNQLSSIDPRNVGRSWTYDRIGRPIAVTDEFGKSDSTSYDPAGNVIGTRSRQGDHTSTTYDAVNRPQQRILHAVVVDNATEHVLYAATVGTVLVPADTASFEYGVAGLSMPTRAANRNSITRRTYALDGAVLTEIDSLRWTPEAYVKSYTYNRAAQRTQIVTPRARNFTYTYDNSGLMSQVNTAAGNAALKWFQLGGRDSLRLPDGSGTKYYYDGDALLSRIYTYHPNITPLENKGIVDTYVYYNGAGRPDSLLDYSTYAQGGSGDKTIFLYDGRGQVTSVSGPSTTHTYAYDGSGNRISENAGGSAISYTIPSGTNRLLALSEQLGATLYHHDDNGAIVTDSTRNLYSLIGPSGFFRRFRKSYYDAAGRRIFSKIDSLAYNSSGVLVSTFSPPMFQYRYDAFGRLLERQNATGGDIRTLLDGNTMLGIGNYEIVSTGLDEPIMILAPAGQGICGASAAYFVTNGDRLFDYHRPNGTTCIEPGNNGWETYGQQAGAIAGSYSFAMRRSSDQSGLSFFRNRFYDSKTGRFTQEDPIGIAGGLNLYAYAGNNPATYTDPFGLCPEGQIEGRNGECITMLGGPGPLSAIGPPIARWGTVARFATTLWKTRSLSAALSSARVAGRAVVEMAKQGKHIPGHANFISGRSIFSHSDPQSLLTHFAGTGTRVRGTAGQAGYVERVNFGQSIGTWIDEAGNQAETTWGLIHYSNRGAHIVPARPGGF